MNYKVDAFKLSDWDEIEPREELKVSLEHLKRDVVYEEVYQKGMPFFTCRIDGKVIAIYGMLYGGEGTYMPSVLVCKDVHKYMKTLVKLFYGYFATYVPRTCRRMEAYCDIMDKKAIRLAKHFGFEPVGIRHYASPEGHDQVIMERLCCCDSRKVRKVQ